MLVEVTWQYDVSEHSVAGMGHSVVAMFPVIEKNDEAHLVGSKKMCGWEQLQSVVQAKASTTDIGP